MDDATALIQRADHLLVLARGEAGGVHVDALRRHILALQEMAQQDMSSDVWVMMKARIAELEDAVRLMSGSVATELALQLHAALLGGGGGGGAAAAVAPVKKAKGTIVEEVLVLLRDGELVKAKKTISRNRTVSGLVAAIVERIKQEHLAQSIAGFSRWLENLPTSWPALQGLKM